MCCACTRARACASYRISLPRLLAEGLGSRQQICGALGLGIASHAVRLERRAPPPCAHSSWHPPLRRKGPDKSARTANSREPPPGIVDLPLPPAWARLAGAAVPAGSGSRPAPSTRARAAACTPRLRNAVERHAAAAHASTTSQRSTPASVCAHFAGRGQYAIPNTPPRTRMSSSRGCLRPRAARGRQAHHGVDDAR